MNTKVLLSICIPTYNQSQSVIALLDAIEGQYTPNIEVLIRDDSSDGQTKAALGKKKYTMPIRYFAGKKAGLDLALIFLVEQAVGDFVWWIGDDIISQGSVEKIIFIIRKYNNLSFIWVNSCSLEDQNLLSIEDRGTYLVNDRNYFLRFEDVGLLGFITATIFNRGIALQGLDSAKKTAGSAFTCLYIVLDVITRGGIYYYLGKPCFQSKYKPPGEARWYDQVEVFGINLFHIFMAFENKFSPGVVRSAIDRNLVRVLRAIVVERAMGLQTGFASKQSKIRPLFKVYKSYWSFWKYLPLLTFPTFVLRLLYWIYLLPKRRHLD